MLQLSNGMKLKTLLCYGLLSLVGFSCDSLDVLGINQYQSIGTFDTKLEAQRVALELLLKQYDKLPANDFRKLGYTFRDVDPTMGNRHAMWYSRKEQRLGIEVDLHSGMTCTWYEVDKTTLEYIVKANLNLAGVDSLAKSTYNNSHCL